MKHVNFTQPENSGCPASENRSLSQAWPPGLPPRCAAPGSRPAARDGAPRTPQRRWSMKTCRWNSMDYWLVVLIILKSLKPPSRFMFDLSLSEANSKHRSSEAFFFGEPWWTMGRWIEPSNRPPPTPSTVPSSRPGLLELQMFRLGALQLLTLRLAQANRSWGRLPKKCWELFQILSWKATLIDRFNPWI